MSTEVWLRNPADFIREAVEVNHLMFAWDHGYLVKRSLDGKKYLDLQVPEPFQYRMLVIGEQGTSEVNRQSSMEEPSAVYPTWCYGEPVELLEEIVFRPVGEDPSVCEDDSIPLHVRPVLGQEHRVVVTDLPNMGSGPGKKFIRYLSALQEDAPDCIIHVHGLYSYRISFGLGFRSSDVDPRTTAQKGKVCLPMGRVVRYEATAKNMQWVNLLGFEYSDLEVPRNRCMYNIKSAVWAAENWDNDLKFITQPGTHVPDSLSPIPKQPQASAHRTYREKAKPGDMLACDTCSLADECKYFRKGAVCTVPRSEGKKIADMFRSRDADQIIDALGSIIGKQSDRVEVGLANEDLDDDLDPEVTKMMNSLFKNGVQLAKLVNPELNKGGQSVMVNVGNGHAAGVFSVQQMTAKIIAELEDQGIPRSEITNEMVMNVLDPERQKSNQAMIEAEVVRERAESD